MQRNDNGYIRHGERLGEIWSRVLCAMVNHRRCNDKLPRVKELSLTHALHDKSIVIIS